MRKDKDMHIGQQMYKWAGDLYPICRSLTGDGNRKTLSYLKSLLPDIKIHEVPTGTEAFDWTVPEEWNIRDAFVADESGRHIIDFNKSNLHVMGYSEPVDQWMTFAELDKHLYSLPERPDAVPYVTSYYKRRWGFCLSDSLRSKLRKRPQQKYHVKIDSTLEPGHMTYGELLIPGMERSEVLLSTYICHPSMANNEISGLVVATALARLIHAFKDRRHSYRILFVPETIGSIVYISRHLDELRKNTLAGFVVSCVGDERAYSYVASRLGNTLADRVARHVLKHHDPSYKSYTFLDRGSDERQFCSPGVDLPACVICRSKYAEYPEYHTSLDNMDLITPAGLQGAYEVLSKCIELLEANRRYRTTVLCEPQLGKRGLYPSVSTRNSGLEVRPMMNVIAYSDGAHDLIDIAEMLGTYAGDLIPHIKLLSDNGLLELV